MNKSIVKNVLILMPKHLDKAENMENILSDAKSFRWKKTTTKAIVKGINLCYENKNSFFEFIGGLE